MNLANPASAGIMNFLIMGVFVLGMYFLLIRPNSKKRKQEEEMRNNIEVGDEVTTIGGIVGRVVGTKQESSEYIIETGTDRVKIKIKKWAIANVENNNKFVVSENKKAKYEENK